MTLADVVRSLASYDADPEAALTIYAREPFEAASPAVVRRDASDGRVPGDLRDLGLSYFLEISIARELAAAIPAASAAALLARLIQYAVRDA